MKVPRFRKSGENAGLTTALGLSPLMTMTLALLAALAVGAGVFVVYSFTSEGPSPADVASEWRPPARDGHSALDSKPASADVHTLSRPIFSKSRRPAPAAKEGPRKETAATIVELPPGVSVRAIAKTGKSLQAFVASSDKPEGGWLKTGDSVEGWTIHKIDRLHVILESDGRSAELKLYPNPSDRPSPPANAPPTGEPVEPPPPEPE